MNEQTTEPAAPTIDQATAYRANRLAVVNAVADYDVDPTEANLWQIKTASLALETTLVDTDIPDDLWNELRHARKRAKNTPAGMKRFRSAIDRVSGWVEAVHDN